MSNRTKSGLGERARGLLSDTIVCDTTLPWGPDYQNQDTILPRMKDGGASFISLTVGIDRMSRTETVKHIAAQRKRLMRDWGDSCHLVESVDDIYVAREAGKLAVGFHFQGSNPLDGDINMVELYYQLGVRHMLFAYNQRNRAADGCHELSDGGLSRFGVSLVEEMNRVGMIVDATHCGYRSSMEMMEMSSAPAVFSHSNARNICPHARNLRDDQIKACAATGGFIGINGVGHFLSDDMVATPEAWIRHVDYIAELIGPEHIAIGLDHVYYLEQQHARRRSSPDTYPEGYPPPDWPGSYLGPDDYVRLVEKLIERGYSESEIRAIMGENFLRVAREVWK
ncbi:membrane dipeptidase [Pelagibius sp. CAU 1746]|uniref:dipeptidase n=1 Tax=Pelagibius sp. CAU 1746 TaxID=3140370 RepID=UPI00325C20BD